MASTSYIYKLANDPEFVGRLTVAAAQAGEPFPEVWAREHALTCAIVVPEPAEKYETALLDPYRDKPALSVNVLSEDNLALMVEKVQKQLAEARKTEIPSAPSRPL